MLGYNEVPVKMATDEEPRETRRAEDVNPVYFSSFDFIDMDGKGIQWFDGVKGEYVSFDSYSEKLRYGLQCYKIPSSVVETLASQKGRAWSSCDIHKIAMAFYSLGESAEEIVKRFS